MLKNGRRILRIKSRRILRIKSRRSAYRITQEIKRACQHLQIKPVRQPAFEDTLLEPGKFGPATSFLASLHGGHVKRLLQNFRALVVEKLSKQIVVDYMPGHSEEPSAAWWNLLCSDDDMVALLSKETGIIFSMPEIGVTRYGTRYVRGKSALRDIRGDDPTFYATTICQFSRGIERDALLKVYRIVFGGNAEDDAYPKDAPPCVCPLHRPTEAQRTFIAEGLGIYSQQPAQSRTSADSSSSGALGAAGDDLRPSEV